MFFSIIVPVHNAQDTLNRCVRSVTRQIFGDWELLLIENGSSDDSPALCRVFAGEDARIHALHTQTGPSEARNLGIRAAKGEYLLFLDADDCFCGSLECLASGMKAKADLYVYLCEYRSPDEQIEPSFYTLNPARLNNASGPDAYKYLFGELRVPGGPCIYAFRREWVHSSGLSFPQGFSLGEDLCFVTQAVWQAKRVQLVPKTLVCFTQNEGGSLSSQITAESFEALWQAARIGAAAAELLPPKEQERFLIPYRNSVLWLLCETGKFPKRTWQPDPKIFRRLALFLRTGKSPRHRLTGSLCLLLGPGKAPQAAAKLQTSKAIGNSLCCKYKKTR